MARITKRLLLRNLLLLDLVLLLARPGHGRKWWQRHVEHGGHGRNEELSFARVICCVHNVVWNSAGDAVNWADGYLHLTRSRTSRIKAGQCRVSAGWVFLIVEAFLRVHVKNRIAIWPTWRRGTKISNKVGSIFPLISQLCRGLDHLTIAQIGQTSD